MKIIDSRVRLRTDVLLDAWTTNLRPVFQSYINLYKMEPRLTEMSISDLLQHAQNSGVEKFVVCGGNDIENQHILELSHRYDAIIPVAGIKLEQGIRVALERIRQYQEQGFASINLAPFMEKLDTNDKRLYPVYAYCELNRIPIIVHASIHFWRESYMWHGQPEYVDEVAVDFPELKFIMSHGGNGFGQVVLAIAQRHPNVYLEFSALNPNYMAPEFITAANTYLYDKCLFGTDYPLVEFDGAVSLWQEALRESVWERFFYQNTLDALYKDPVSL